jgi:hypothetical protein
MERPTLSKHTIYGNNIPALQLDPVALRADAVSLESYQARLEDTEQESGWTYPLGCELTWARKTIFSNKCDLLRHRRAVRAGK